MVYAQFLAIFLNSGYNERVKSYSMTKDNEFKHPETEVDFHWWTQNSVVLHHHDYYEFFIITDGETVHKINGKTTVISKNTLYFVRPQDLHMFSSVNGQPSQHFNIAVTENMLIKICDAIDPLLFQKIKDGTLPVSINMTEAEFNFFIRLTETPLVSDSDSLTSMTIVSKQIIVNALSLLYHKSAVDVKYPKWFKTLLRQISAPEFLSSHVSEIYKLSNYTPPMLLHYFKLYTGNTIIFHFTKIKINYACNLLEKTNFSTLEIAGKIGFDSLSHFSRLFKKHIGKTPIEYRNGFKHAKT